MSRHHQTIKNDPRWKAARLACLDRDGHTCRDCGATAEDLTDAPREDQLQADHIEELATAPDLAFEVDNLATRCGPCNRARHHAGPVAVRRHWTSPKYAQALTTAGVAP